MPLLPDKFALGARLAQNTRTVAGIESLSPAYAAGQNFGNAIAGLGVASREKPPGKEPDKSKPAAGVLALSEAQTAIDTAGKDLAAAADPDQDGIDGADYLQQAKAKIQSSLGADDLKRYGPSIEAMIESGMKRLGEQVEGRRREAKVAEVETLFPQLAAQHAALADPTARQEIGAALFGSIDKLREAGDIDEGRAQAMKLDLQRQLVRADVQAQPTAWQMEKLQPAPDGKTNFWIDTLGGEDAEYLRAQAGLRDKAEKRDGTTQSLLDRFGTAPASESKALAEIDTQHGGDPGLRRLYLARLQMQRRQEGRELAQSAGNFYALAREGRLDEIDPADSRRLHKAGQMEGVLEAAQYGRNAEAPGDLLFRERYLAMGEDERARIKPAELARKLAPQDFLEVMQGASGGIDETQRTRMQGFVQAVTPMLRSVTVGKYATPQEQERDRRLLGLVHDEVKTLVADEEKKLNGRALTPVEYQEIMRRAAYRALARNVNLEIERHGPQWLDAAPEVE